MKQTWCSTTILDTNTSHHLTPSNPKSYLNLAAPSPWVEHSASVTNELLYISRHRCPDDQDNHVTLIQQAAHNMVDSYDVNTLFSMTKWAPRMDSHCEEGQGNAVSTILIQHLYPRGFRMRFHKSVIKSHKREEINVYDNNVKSTQPIIHYWVYLAVNEWTVHMCAQWGGHTFLLYKRHLISPPK